MKTTVVTFWDLEESQFLARLRKVIEEAQLIHTSFQLKNALQLEDADEVDQAIQKSIRIFQQLNITVSPHFQQVYCAHSNCIRIDWRLSSFAYLLVLINCNSDNFMVAKAQIELIRNKLTT